MGKYEELAAEFFTRYEYPDLEEFTVGFSDIDPPKKIKASEIDHEQLDGLLGGNWQGHYHLTKELWEYLNDLVNTKDFDGGFASTAEGEYLLNFEYWFDGGADDTPDEDYEETEDNWADGGGV